MNRFMSYNDRIFCKLLLVAVIVTGLPTSPDAAPGNYTAGKTVYTQLCVSCHGADGRGGRTANMLAVSPQNLASSSWLQTRTVEKLFNIIKQGGEANGLSAAMPAFGNQLTDNQIRDAVAYITTLSTATEGTTSPATPLAASTPSNGLHITRMRLSIWPEYDDPRVLIIIRGEVASTRALPVKLKLPIPKGAELIGAGMISPQNTLLNHPHSIESGDLHDTLELTLPIPRFFVEWYHDPFIQATGSSERQFSYSIALPYSIDQLEIDIQKPYEATDFLTFPETTKQRTNAQGGRFYQFTYPNVPPGQSTSFTVTYVKTTDRPSVKKQRPASQQQPSSSRWGNSTTIPFAMLAGATAVYMGCVIAWRRFGPPAPAQVRPITTIPVPFHSTPQPLSLPPNFCSQCGRQIESAYGFCPNCGQSIQRSSSRLI